MYLAYIKSNFIQSILKLYNDSLSLNNNWNLLVQFIIYVIDKKCVFKFIFIAYLSIFIFNKIK